MYPTLIDFGTFTIGTFQFQLAVHSYGTMLAIAILSVLFLMKRELVRKKMDPEIASSIFFAAVIGGLIGAKLYYVLVFREFSLGAIFSNSGLVWHGGLLGGTIGVLAALYIRRAPVLPVIDALGPLLMLGYAIARIGCFLSGDGDYGPPSDLPWAMAFPNGTVPTDVPVHPTPLYELILSLAVFALLWRVRRVREQMPGWLFGGYLILSSGERFLAEFWRLNEKIMFGMSAAQVISIFLALLGAWFVYRAPRRPRWSPG